MMAVPSLVSYAIALVDNASNVGLCIRLTGSVAVRTISGPIEGRPDAIKDIDVVTEKRDRRRLQTFLSELDWQLDDALLLVAENRETYLHSSYEFTIDAYYDEIDGNHQIPVRGHLAEAFPTIPHAELLLSKLQRRSLRSVDLWDMCALAGAHSLELRRDRFALLTGADWGLFTTVVESLATLRAYCPEAHDLVATLEAAMSRGPFTLGFRLRKLIGKRFQWWQPVYEASVRRHVAKEKI